MNSPHNDGVFARFAIRQQLRSMRWYLAAMLFAVFLLSGVFFTNDKRSMYMEGIVLAIVVALNYGIGYDRRAGFDKFNSNFVRPDRQLMQRVFVLLVLYGALLVSVFIVTALGWLDARAALYQVTRTAIFFGPLLGLSLVLEVLIATMFPSIVSIILLSTTLSAVILKWGEDAVKFLGMEPTTAAFRDLGRMFVVSTVLNLGFLLIAIAIWSFQHRRRRITPP